MNTIYIFGYGSLLNAQSRAKTFDEQQVITGVYLHGFQRKCNACSKKHIDLGMNIVRNPKMSVEGVLIKVLGTEFPKLESREDGYQSVDISDFVSVDVADPVFTFIAPDEKSTNIILRTYLDTCLGGIHLGMHDLWLKETIFENEIYDDRKDPLYPNYVPLINDSPESMEY